MTLYQHTLTRRLHRGVARIATVTLALLLLATGCNEEGVSRPSPELAFSLVSSSATQAEIGQSIVVDWEYTEASQLRAQTVKLIRLSMAGLVTVEDELPRTQRSTSFAFNGPVTVVITATDRRGRQIDAAFDVRLSSDYHFRLQGVVASHPGYPRLGQQQVGVVTTGRTTRSPRLEAQLASDERRDERALGLGAGPGREQVRHRGHDGRLAAGNGLGNGPWHPVAP